MAGPQLLPRLGVLATFSARDVDSGAREPIVDLGQVGVVKAAGMEASIPKVSMAPAECWADQTVHVTALLR